MTLKLNGSSSGHVNLDAKAAAASNTLTLPDTASGELVAADSSGNITVSGNLSTPASTTTRIGATDATSGTAAGGTVSINAGAARGAGQAVGVLQLLAGRGNNSASNGHIIFGHGDGASGTTVDGTFGRIDSDGLKFNADTAASNALADYEEGTFQPSWNSAGVGLSFSYSANHRHGYYTKIGNLVTFNLYISSTAAPSGDATNTLYISGLPYTSANVTGNSTALTIGFYYNMTAADNEVFPLAYVNKNSATVTLLWSRRNSQVSQHMISSDLTDYTYLILNGSYRV